jgi:hypothetical protein
VLYETWARHEDHSFYPNRFVDPAEMQSQLRFHYNDAATSYVPSNASQTVNPAIEVAPVGDAWEHHLGQPDPVRLHASDDYHAGSRGQYLNALVIYSTLYRRSALDLTSRALAGEDALRLQLAADAVTGQTVPGGPTGMPKPVGLTRGETVRIDFGDRITSEIGWNNLDDATSGALGNLVTTEGESSTVDIAVTDNFGGVNNAGIGANGLGYPATASEDSLFAGSFDDHADGLLHPGEVTISGLDPQARYRAEIFASRSGSDNGRGRLTRFVVGGTFQDLEVSDNTDVYVTYLDLIPSSQGEIAIEVAVSPDGTSRFAYIGVLHLTRQ